MRTRKTLFLARCGAPGARAHRTSGNLTGPLYEKTLKSSFAGRTCLPAVITSRNHGDYGARRARLERMEGRSVPRHREITSIYSLVQLSPDKRRRFSLCILLLLLLLLPRRGVQKPSPGSRGLSLSIHSSVHPSLFPRLLPSSSFGNLSEASFIRLAASVRTFSFLDGRYGWLPGHCEDATRSSNSSSAVR